MVSKVSKVTVGCRGSDHNDDCLNNSHPATHNILCDRSLYTYGDAYTSVCMAADAVQVAILGHTDSKNRCPKKKSFELNASRATSRMVEQ